MLLLVSSRREVWEFILKLNYKLANIVCCVDDHAISHSELYYRIERGSIVHALPGNRLQINGTVDFMTYVNGFSALKWSQYAQLDEVCLNLVLDGSGLVHIYGVEHGSLDPVQIKQVPFSPENGLGSLAISVCLENFDLIGFSISSEESTTATLVKGCYTATVDGDEVNRVDLALSTTTFKNERYIIPNIDLVKEGISKEDGPICDHFHMFVVDNGQTLDSASLSDDLVTVLPNPNTGGSGGFARGMMAATETPDQYTHIILMDDDVSIMPESLIRTFNLLSLAKGKYKDAFINGAMLSMEDPTRQFEDVSYVATTGAYRRVKEDLNVGKLSDILENERTNVEVDQAYGAWWYSCIPVRAIEKNGLPMPFFIRCDDVEFGMRNKPVYMTMNCICVWHASFEGRFRASVDCYQYFRNFFAMIALDDCADEKMFVLRIQRGVRQNLRDMDYQAAEFILDGFEDYLRGPEYLQKLDGAATMIGKGKLNEKLIPVSQMDPKLLRKAGVTEQVLANVNLEFHPSKFMKYWRSIPYDKHYLPDALLRGKPGYVVKNGSCTLEGNSTRCKTLVFLDPTREKGSVRTMDRARFKSIRRREHELMVRYRKEGKSVRGAWKDAMPYMTSREFWEQYLGLK